jgi:hypothetical protein
LCIGNPILLKSWPTHWFHEWSKLWPAGYSLIKLKEELWMHVVLCGLGPSFQHIRNGYADAEKQDATTLK